MKKDNSFVKQWLHKLDPEPHLEGLITEAGWELLKENLSDSTYNQIITQFEGKLESKKAEINKQIEDRITNLKKEKM